MQSIRDTLEGALVGIVLTAFTYFVGLQYGWITQLDNLEAAGVFFNYACVWLVARQSMMNWPLGLIASTLLGILFYKLGLFSSMVLSIAYFIPVQLWGWWNWKYGGTDKTELKVSFMSIGQMVNITALGGIAWFAVAQINTYFGATSPILDTGILVLSIVAQYLLGLKKIESWIIWISVNVLSIYVYGSGGAFLLAFQYFFFLLNAFWGFYRWMVSYKNANMPVKFGRAT